MKRASWFLLLLLACWTGPVAAESTANKSWLLPLGAKAPDFKLPDVVTHHMIALSDTSDKKVLMVIFICRHCPYVQHIKKVLGDLGREYQGQSVAIIAISSNDPAAYPEDAPESLAEMSKEEAYPFPLLFDETQAVARKYTAVATPDVFIFNSKRKLAYRGQFDDSRPGGSRAADGKDVRLAIERLLRGQPLVEPQKPAVGCSIQWKNG